jgi:hypothetical protein
MVIMGAIVKCSFNADSKPRITGAKAVGVLLI